MLNPLENMGEKALKTDRTPQNDCSVASDKKKPRKRPKPVKYLNTEEIKALFGVITDARDRAIFRVVYHRVLRASEVKLLELSDYRQRDGRLYVRRLKGSKSGEYPLFDEERRALNLWLKKRGTSAGPLFPSRRHHGISRWALDELMKKYCRIAGVAEEKAHMHALKHSSGTHYHARTGDVAATQDHLGHRNIQNTMIYVDITNRRRDELAERNHDWK